MLGNVSNRVLAYSFALGAHSLRMPLVRKEVSKVPDRTILEPVFDSMILKLIIGMCTVAGGFAGAILYGLLMRYSF